MADLSEDLAGGRPQMLTSMPGGAMSPALLPNGSLVFASPVPKIGGTNSSQPPSALYVQSPGGQPRRLTFSSLQHHRTHDACRWKNPVRLNTTAGHQNPPPARLYTRSTTTARKSPPSPDRKIPTPPSSDPGCSRMAASSIWFQSPVPIRRVERRNLFAWPGRFKAAPRCFPGGRPASAQWNPRAMAICWCALKHPSATQGFTGVVPRQSPTRPPWRAASGRSGLEYLRSG